MPVKLTPIQLDRNTIIYVEVAEDVEVSNHLSAFTTPSEDDEEEEAAITKGLKEDFQKHIYDLQSTILIYTNYTLAAFKKVAVANATINKVTLEFGVEMGGEVGIPYITKGTTKSNLKIQVECTFDDKKEQKEEKV